MGYRPGLEKMVGLKKIGGCNIKIAVYYISQLLLIFSFTFSSCAQKNEQVDDRLITKSNVSSIISDSLNLVFLTAEWCPASKSILKKNYTKLCDSLGDKINIVIICASEKDSSFSNYLTEVGIRCPYYVLPNKSSHEKILEHGDRKRIRHFIKNNFIGYKDLDLPWQFGVPVSLFVNKKLEIISKAPQRYELIKEQVMQH